MSTSCAARSARPVGAGWSSHQRIVECSNGPDGATLDYRENHVRGPRRTAARGDADVDRGGGRYDGELVVASATAATVEGAWALLRMDIEADRAVTMSRIRLVRS